SYRSPNRLRLRRNIIGVHCDGRVSLCPTWSLADIAGALPNVRFTAKADIAERHGHVRFVPIADSCTAALGARYAVRRYVSAGCRRLIVEMLWASGRTATRARCIIRGDVAEIELPRTPHPRSQARQRGQPDGRSTQGLSRAPPFRSR